MILHSVQPHNYQLSTLIYSKNPPKVASYIIENRFRRVLRIGDALSLIEVAFQNTPENSLATLTCLYPNYVELNSGLVDCIQNILGLNFDLTEFYELLETNPITKSLKCNLFGLKLLRSASFYESLIEAVTEQQISFKAAISIRRRLAARYSQKIIYEGDEYWEFPPSKTMASANLDELQILGLSKNRANAIIAVSKLDSDGILSELCNSSVTDLFAELIKIKGIGKWTIHYAICRGLGRYDLYPTQDYALKMGIRKLFGESRLKTDKEVERLLSEFGKYSGYLAFYIMYFFIFSKDEQNILPKA
jgi:DNA-3-methyladenine glycosylase II